MAHLPRAADTDPPPPMTVTVMSDAPGEAAAGLGQPSSLGRLGPLLLTSHVAWSLPSAAAGTLLQALIADERPASKVGSAAVITAVGAIAAVISTVVAGGLSDRTRSRFGRRNPWILGGAAVSSLGLALTGLTTVFPLQVFFFSMYQAGLNAMMAALSALLPDRVAKVSLGKASALGGVGYLLGNALGGVAASVSIGSPAVGLRIVPWTMVIAALLVFFLLPGASTADEPRARVDRRALLRSFLPPRDRDFLWAFCGRFCVIMAMFVVAFYQLYLYTDLLGLSDQRASEIIAVGLIVLGGTALTMSALSGWISDRIGRRKMPVVVASLLIAAAMVPPLIVPSVPAMLALYTVAGAGYGMYLSVDQALMVEVLPTKGSEAKELGFLSLANTAPIVLGPAVAAGVVTLVGYRVLFAFALTLALVGATCVARIRRVR